jgi:hypothetical protein
VLAQPAVVNQPAGEAQAAFFERLVERIRALTMNQLQ